MGTRTDDHYTAVRHPVGLLTRHIVFALPHTEAQ